MKLIILLAFTIACVSAASLESLVFPGFPEGRIINGQDAEKGAAPYIVSLNSDSHFCAGCIIDKHWLVTAAHCLVYENFKAIAGLHQLNNESDVQIRQVTGEANQIIHENFTGEIGPYDIGLIYIEEAFDLNASTAVAKINLASGKYQQTGPGTLYGWGRDNSGAMSNTLQKLDANIIDYSECKSALPSSAPVDPVNICTYTAGTTDSACDGDSGGPLVINTEEGPELVGVVSWGYSPCLTNMYPSVYSQILAFETWIDEQITQFLS